MNPSISWLSELQREPWFMEHRALSAFLAKVSDAAQAARMPSTPSSPAAARNLSVEADGTAVINVKGVLLKAVPWYFEFLGIAATAYPDIEADLAAALADPSVKAIRMDVDSPGGSSAGLKRVADAMFAARGQKPMMARVEDIAASAAYWLASQMDKISAGPTALLGSIGAYTTFLDQHVLAHNLGLKVEVISSANLKGAGVPGTQLTEEQRAEIQKYVDDLTTQFVQDVARGRGVPESKARSWATGGTWLGQEATKMGLADSVETVQDMRKRQIKKESPQAALKFEADGLTYTFTTTDSTIKKSSDGDAAGAGARPASEVNDRALVSSSEEGHMPEGKELEAQKAKAGEDAVAAERSRIADIRKAFGEKDAAFTLTAIEKGWTLQQAKAEWADVVEAKAAQDRQALVETTRKLELLQKPGVTGAPAVPAGGKPEAEATPAKDFMTVSREYAKENKCGMVAAMRHVASTQPELHQAFLDASAAKAPQVRERKVQLGMTV